LPTYPWHKWYPSKWLSSETRFGMNLAERSIYRDLLDCNYERGSLPNDPVLLAQLAGATQEEFDSAWPKVSHCFVPCDGDPARITNPVARDELGRRAERAATTKTRRACSKPDALACSRSNDQQCSSSTDEACSGSFDEQIKTKTKIETETEKKIKTPSGGNFEEFWVRYPNKEGREAALMAYLSVVPEVVSHSLLMAGLAVWLKSEKWSKGGGKFVPKAKNWLFDRAWTDSPTPAVTTGRSGVADELKWD
jgi:Protein of unknown function (DUF1376)